MQTSATSSERASGRDASAVHAQWPAVAPTPLIRLSRSGAGRIHVKHEGYSAGGSFFDRVVAHQLARADASTFFTADGGAFAVSAAAQVAAIGGTLEVLGSSEGFSRVEPLVRRFGASIASADGEGLRSHSRRSDACRILQRNDAEALVAALRDVAREVHEAGVRPSLWVLPDYGIAPSAVRTALETDAPAFLELVADDFEAPRALDGPYGCRRVQTAQREGILLSPLGAELVDAAVNAADEVEGDIIALVPESGHRYLGWW